MQITPNEAQNLVGKKARFHTDDGVTTVKVESVDYPYALTAGMRIDLREVHKAEVVEFSTGKTLLLFFGISVAIAFLYVIVYEIEYVEL